MSIILIILAILAIAGGVVLIYDKKHVGSTLLIVTGVLVFVSAFSFKIVPTGYTGVKTTFGQVSEDVVPTGFNVKIPFVQSIKLVNNKQQDVAIDAKVWGESIEKTPVFASDITVTYQISGDKSAWISRNVSDVKNLVSTSVVASAIKSAMVQLPASSVTVRTKIETLAREELESSLAGKYGDGTISILKVVIDNMDFEDSYNAAIAEKSIAQQKKEKQEIENATAISKAEADKKVSISNAEAKAEATRIAAEAEAEANRLRTESLTEAVLTAKFYEKWNGVLPSVMGENTVITDVGR